MANPPKWLGEIGRKKWRELVAQRGEPMANEADLYGMFAASWAGYIRCHANVLANGSVYTQTANGRQWNNPDVENESKYAMQYIRAKRLLGLLPNGGAGNDEKPEGLD